MRFKLFNDSGSGHWWVESMTPQIQLCKYCAIVFYYYIFKMSRVLKESWDAILRH
jgi:hypothetical protein